MILGKGIAPFTKELAKETGKTLRQAQKLLSTELTRVQVQSSMQAMKDSGFDEFQLIANPNCCDEFQKIDGKHYKIKDLASGENAPPMHPNCRCSVAAYVDDDTDDDFDEAAFDEWSETYDEHGLSWEEWQDRIKEMKMAKIYEDKITGKLPPKPLTVNAVEDFNALKAYAATENIEVSGFEDFQGDLSLIYDQVDSIKLVSNLLKFARA